MAIRLESFRMPRYREIPDVGLYLDQTVKYINRYVAPLGCVEITASMVSNYVKKGYIRNPVHKQYDAKQIVQLFFIAVVKNVLSMENIGYMFDCLEAYPLDAAYNFFCDEFERLLAQTFGSAPPERTETQDMSSAYPVQMFRSVITAVVHVIYLSDCFAALREEKMKLPAIAPVSAPLQQ